MERPFVRSTRHWIAACLVLTGGVFIFGVPFAGLFKGSPEWPCAVGIALIGGGTIVAIRGTPLWLALVVGVISPFAAFIIFTVLFWSGLVISALIRLLFSN
jgi:hypothetical protein